MQCLSAWNSKCKPQGQTAQKTETGEKKEMKPFYAASFT